MEQLQQHGRDMKVRVQNMETMLQALYNCHLSHGHFPPSPLLSCEYTFSISPTLRTMLVSSLVSLVQYDEIMVRDTFGYYTWFC